jgi:hypothetical protein
MAHKLRAGAATNKRDFFLQEWPPRPDSFMRMLERRRTSLTAKGPARVSRLAGARRGGADGQELAPLEGAAGMVGGCAGGLRVVVVWIAAGRLSARPPK